MKTFINSPALLMSLMIDLSNYVQGLLGQDLVEKARLMAPNMLLMAGIISRRSTKRVQVIDHVISEPIPNFENEVLSNYYAEGLKLFTHNPNVPNELDKM